MNPEFREMDLLRSAISGRLITDPEDMARFLTDWRGKWTGKAIAVAQPASTEDVSAVLRWCSEHRVPVVPQGGNTGLSGGSTPDTSGNALVLSTKRMTSIRSVDTVGNTIEVEAGATLSEVRDAAKTAGRLFPLSLAAEGSCTIGGNLATNAGGVQVLRYGNARDLCLGIEVVTPEGEVWNGLRSLRKDNTGYDLRNLYIGAEGTLGIITAAVLKLFPIPPSQVVSFAAIPSPTAAVALFRLAQARLGPSLTAFELVSESAVSLVEKHAPTARRPLEDRAEWYVLLEVSDSEEHANAAIQATLESAFEDGLVSDAAISASLAQSRSMRALREGVSESQGAEGPTIKHDISLPIAKIAQFIEEIDGTITDEYPQVRQVVFGHLGDGNLHYNISPGPAGVSVEVDVNDLEVRLNRLVHDAVVRYGGSISAEHGLGVLRRDEAKRYKSPVELKIMRAIKSALDVHNLMNPGKVL